MLNRRTEGFPLFPLGIVALPTETRAAAHLRGSLPAHDRGVPGGRAGRGREFGIVWLSEEELKPIGCACEIERVLERMEEGRMNILVRGTQPFRLLERQDDYPYPAGIVEPLLDSEEELDADTARIARELYARAGRAGDRQASERGGAGRDGRLHDGGDGRVRRRRQAGAARAALGERAHAPAHLLLRAAIKRLELVERAQARARSNGKVRFG